MLDDFLKITPSANKVPILVAPRESSLAAIRNSMSCTCEVIKDHEHLGVLRNRVLKESKFGEIRRRASNFINSFGLETAYQTPTGDKYSAGMYPNIVPKRDDLPATYVVYENEIDSDGFSALISPLALVPEENRPKIILQPKSITSELLSKLSAVKDKVDVHEIGAFGLSRIDHKFSTEDDQSSSEALQTYLNFGFSAMIDEDIELALIPREREVIVSSVYKKICQINSIIKVNGRSTGSNSIVELLDYLEWLNTQPNIVPKEELVRMKIFANVLHGYVFENSADQIRNALALSHQISDPFLIALSERVVNLSEGLNPSAIHWLNSSEQRFWDLGEPVQAIYARHNRLITTISTTEYMDFAEFVESGELLSNIAPYADRLSSVSQGVGMMHLLDGDLISARKIFEGAQSQPGSWLQRAEARVSHLICDYLLGEIDEQSIISATRSICHQLGDDKPTYHHKRLAYNLMKLSPNKRTLKDVLSLSVDHSIVKKSESKEPLSIIGKVMKKMPVSAPNSSFVGRRGSFFERTRLAPGCGFIWH